MRRHIIVEGPDGSGKDTLIRNLKSFFPLHVLNQRASTSEGGPVENLEAWVMADLASMPTKPASIYNRHPLVSEYVYSDLRKINRGLRLPTGKWIPDARRMAANNALLVICLPPFETVERQAWQGTHMPGVIENLPTIYSRYAAFAWPGVTIRYNRLRNDVETLALTISNYVGVPI